MGFLDGLLGRKEPPPPKLDNLFALPSAAITLQVSLGFEATGAGSVVFRAISGVAFDQLRDELTAILGVDGGAPVETAADSFGYTWLIRRTAPPDVAELVTDLHAVNSTLTDNGYGPSLLATLVWFQAGDGRRLALVYLYKQGTFYPFAPADDAARRRDQMLELQVRDVVGADLPFEPDLARWFALWDAPGG